MADVVYKEDRAGIQQMMIARWMVDAMERIAESGRTHAIQIAPVRTGRYASHFRIWKGIYKGRARAVLSNDVRSLEPSTNPAWPDPFPYGVGLELGTSKMPAQRILLRSIDAMTTPPK